MDLQDVANWTIPEGGVRNLHDKDNRLLWSAVGYDVRYDGDTTQQTYSGKNLMMYDAADMTSMRLIAIPDLALSAGTYTISFDLDSFELGTNPLFYVNMMLKNSSDSTILDPEIVRIDSSTALGRHSHTFTLTSDGAPSANANIRIPNSYWNNGARAKLSNIQIEAGSTPTTYEPYVGGVPAPNPDYPQAVNVVTGEQDVLVSAKNLLSVSFAVSGGVPSDIPTNTFVLDRENQRYFRCDFPTLLPAGTYTISFDVSNNNTAAGVNFTLFGKTEAVILNVTQVSRGSTSSHYSGTFTVNEDIKIIRWFIASNEANDKHATISNVQVEAGPAGTAYEMYQGQHVEQLNLGTTELCKIGNYQDYIFKSSGKNLWGGYTQYDRNNNGIIFSTLSNGNITAQGLASAKAYSVIGSQIVPNNVYITLDAGTYYLSTRGATPTGVSVQIVNEAGSILRADSGSFTLDSPTPLACRLYVASGTDISAGITVEPMLEKGSTATPYEPYGTDWYVHKETGKIVLDGSEDSWSRALIFGGDKYRFHVDVPSVKTTTSETAVGLVISNKLVEITNTAQYAGKQGIKVRSNGSPQLFLYIYDTSTMNIDAFKTWLSSNNITCYYALETPTDTKITDTTLLSQLSAVHNWLTRYDYYGIVSGDLPIIINKTEIT